MSSNQSNPFIDGVIPTGVKRWQLRAQLPVIQLEWRFVNGVAEITIPSEHRNSIRYMRAVRQSAKVYRDRKIRVLGASQLLSLSHWFADFHRLMREEIYWLQVNQDIDQQNARAAAAIALMPEGMSISEAINYLVSEGGVDRAQLEHDLFAPMDITVRGSGRPLTGIDTPQKNGVLSEHE